MRGDVSRRTFLCGAVAGAVTAGAKGALEVPRRTLGRTGVRAPIIGMGCGESWWKALNDEERCAEALNAAVDAGITYLDTGQTYGKGLSETWIGRAIGNRRSEVFLSTKISVRDGQEALRETDRCLKRLQTDRLDLVHIHNLQREDDLERIEAKGGLLEAVYRLRDQKIARFIGITSHFAPAVLKTAIERHDFDCTQMALNAALQGHYNGNSSYAGHSFESVALPAAKKKNLGVIAMKATGRGNLLGVEPAKAGAPELIRYVLSLPVAVAVVGMSDLGHIRENAGLARGFKPMSDAEKRQLSGRMAVAHKAALDRFFAEHEDV